MLVPITFRKRCAFTLAEVLITLGIIGVVAAMTIPTLVAKYQKKVTATRVKQTYSQLLQAIQLSEVQNGPMSDWDLDQATNAKENSKLFVEKYIKPYFQGLQYCSDGADFKCGVPVSGDGANYFLNNGVSLSFVKFPSVRNYFDLLVDVNGAKGPSVNGRDYFMFDTRTGSLKPYFWFDGIKRENILEGFSYSQTDYSTWNIKIECQKNKNDEDDMEEANRGGCTALLMLDGWEFKDDYPW